jgi:1-deoxy-D-xylulose-5-phosphate synthase
VLREGDDLLMLAVGSTVYPALEAADVLSREGIDATVVNARFIKPLDEERLLPLILRIRKVITVEENVLAGGFGSGILEMVHDCTDGASEVEVKRIGIPDGFVEHGTTEELRSRYGLDAQGIVQTARQWLERPAVMPMHRQSQLR